MESGNEDSRSGKQHSTAHCRAAISSAEASEDQQVRSAVGNERR